MASAPGLLVQHARLLGGAEADRHHLAAALERVRLPALGLSPRATLVLGRVIAPAPLARDGSPEPFVRRLEETLRRRATNARRGPAGGGDWLFEDEETLEVALVAAWLDRTAAATMLLRMVAGGGAPEPRIRWRRTILTDGERAARTVARLAEAGLAAPWLAGFEAGELEAAAGRIRASHGGAGSAAEPLPSGPAGPTSAGSGSPPPAAALGIASTLCALGPEAEALPAGAPARRLVLTALAAQRRPALLLLPELVEAVGLAAAAPSRPRPLPAARPSPTPLAPAAEAHVRAEYHPSGTATAPRANAARPQPSPPRTGKPPALARAEAAPVPSRPEPPSAWSDPIGHEQPQPTCRTSFGGLLFLLNAFIALDLWGDFTRPRSGPPGLSPFELLLLLGRNWYGQAFDADPLHARLRELAGLRPGEAPGMHFAAPEWHVPADWLTPWPRARPRAHRGAAWHAAGFPLNDPAYAARSATTRRRYWVAALGRYLAARLAAALGTGDSAAARDLVCRRDGELSLGADALLLLLSLHDHPLEIRFAGLDRDPGRLAGTDRAVRFEFSG